MLRVASSRRLRRAVPALAICMLVPGCAMLSSEPLVLGSSYRSIKDDQAEQLSAPPALPKTQPKKAAPATPKRRVVTRLASGPPADDAVCEGERSCIVRLKMLIDNPDRSWIGQPEPPVDHATGTRLFAYRALRAKLSCEELVRAIDELEAAAATFRAPIPGIDERKAGRVRTLNAAVETELRAERMRRCTG